MTELTKPTQEPSSHPVISAPAKRLVVAGNGMVGFKFLERLTALDQHSQFSVTVFGEEPRPAYDRVHLTDFFRGKTPDALLLQNREWYEAKGIELHVNDPVVGINPTAQKITAKSGRTLEYNQLILATGSRPFVPPIDGAQEPGVFVYRTVEDMERIQAKALESRRAAVMGGGLLGLEAADALRHLGLETHIVERNIGLMTQQLPVEGSRILEREVVNRGFHVHLNKNTKSIRTDHDSTVLEFQNGEALMVDMVIIASGIRPRDELGRAAGLKIHPRGGIVVNDHLQTSDPAICAIGECANHRGTVYGLVSPGFRMADVLAARIHGRQDRFSGDFLAARLKLLGVDVATFGDHQGDGESIQHEQRTEFRRLVIRRNRLVGATVVGPTPELNRIQEAVDSKRRIWQWNKARFKRSGLLWPRTEALRVAQWPPTALVCNCCQVQRKTLSEAITSHQCDTVEALSDRTGAGSVCGSCRPLLANLLGARPVAVPTKGYVGLLVASVVSAIIGLIIMLAPPVSQATSVTQVSLNFLWTDSFWKLASGYALVGISVLSLALSLRKRLRKLQFGNFGIWRMLHSILGCLTLFVLIAHTGFRLGQNLNFVLMTNFLTLVALGALAGLFTALETRLTSPWARRLRQGGTVLHITLFWPLPVLIFFHALKSYYY